MKTFTTNDLAGDLEVLFAQTDLYYGQDGNLYSESEDGILAYVSPAEKDEDGVVTLYKVEIAE